eukprot:TRINITY_DN5972_c0_g1_i1.p1 TRINITY_DN5972_c0_g1~~TRINITY_DN5972_c0_g1_i1.p1  ORF type:complete len:229 (-),score=45.45 TRINITY_DN5972_c0_g1_i1:49-735(-)
MDIAEDWTDLKMQSVYLPKRQAEDECNRCRKIVESMKLGSYVALSCEKTLPGITLETSFKEDYVKNPSIQFNVKKDHEQAKDLIRELRAHFPGFSETTSGKDISISIRLSEEDMKRSEEIAAQKTPAHQEPVAQKATTQIPTKTSPVESAPEKKEVPKTQKSEKTAASTSKATTAPATSQPAKTQPVAVPQNAATPAATAKPDASAEVQSTTPPKGSLLSSIWPGKTK